MSLKKECPFCDLTKLEIFYQDDYCFGMIISEPLKDGHLMVVPKRHVENLSDLKSEESQAILNLLGRLRKIIPQIYKDDPIILMNTGDHSTIDHIHFHILPSKGGLRDLFSKFEGLPYRQAATKQELAKMAQKIKDKIK